MALDWQGDDVKRKMEGASALGIDATMSAAIMAARQGHGAGARGMGRFQSQSGELERGTRIVQRAARRGRHVVGRWGVIAVVYARRIELGFQGKDSRGRVIAARPYPYLRPAAEKEYPNLKRRIRTAARFA